MSKIELMQGDCLEKMKDIPDGSINFMGVEKEKQEKVTEVQMFRHHPWPLFLTVLLAYVTVLAAEQGPGPWRPVAAVSIVVNCVVTSIYMIGRVRGAHA